MLKLYYSPGACSIVSHIALEEAGAKFEPMRVVLAQGEHLTADYLAINPHARVPALGTDRGVLTENIAILNYIADVHRAPGSVPRDDPDAAARCNELLGWFASTVHISFAQVWRAGRFTRDESVHPTIIAGGRENLSVQFDEIEALCVDEWLASGHFSAADGYALTFLRWAKRIEFPIDRYPQWVGLVGRVLERPAVRRALDREGLSAAEFRPA
ncbi:MAG TPA: glutathione S-transferase N-terminal domain-containing protein [Sphingomicrobium sp.]|nr:glutathione S-transferase N-terminal domain-containing protein [Sphingomicrobium sp.]